jgi:hypothetical protein
MNCSRKMVLRNCKQAYKNSLRGIQELMPQWKTILGNRLNWSHIHKRNSTMKRKIDYW